jgi:hypothetical protein
MKSKCTLVQALRLCTGRTAHGGSRGIALLLLDHGTRRDCGVSVTPRPLFTSGREPVSIVQEAGWTPGPVWTGAENLVPPPPGFDPRTVQPVASCYTDYATRSTQITNATDINSEHVILIVFPLLPRLRERASILHYTPTHIAFFLRA